MSWISRFRPLMRRGRLSGETEEELEFSKLTGDQQTILLLAFRERRPHRVIAQIARCSERSLLQSPLRPCTTLRPRFDGVTPNKHLRPTPRIPSRGDLASDRIVVGNGSEDNPLHYIRRPRL